MHSKQGGEQTLQLLWGVTDPSTRGPRPRFTVHDLAAAACRLADEEGLGSVTLAKLAANLGLTTTAVYRYVDSKSTLVDLMTDHAVGLPPTLDDQDWKQAVRQWVHGLWNRYMDHPWLAEIRVTGMPRHPNRLNWLNSLLLVLDRGAAPDPLHLALVFDSLARGFATLPPSAPTEPAPDWLSVAIRDRFPRLGLDLSRNWTDTEAQLTRAVDTILASRS